VRARLAFVSPEFVSQMRPGSAFPDYKRYGVMWMGRRALGQAYDMHGAFNHLALSLRPQGPALAPFSQSGTRAARHFSEPVPCHVHGHRRLPA